MNLKDTPAFRDYRAPSDASAMDRVRSQIATNFAQLDIPMTLASTAYPGNSNGWVILNIAGTTLYVDTDPSLGNAVASLQFNLQQDAGAARFYAQPGQSWESITFKQIALSWAAQPGKIMRLMYSMDGRVFPSVQGQAVSATIVNAANAAVPFADAGITYAASFKSQSSLIANAPDPVWSAAANVNGVTVLQADILSVNGTGPAISNLLCKATAPTVWGDGVIVLQTSFVAGPIATFFYSSGQLRRAVNIPAGLRGDWINNISDTQNNLRSVLYTIK